MIPTHANLAVMKASANLSLSVWKKMPSNAPEIGNPRGTDTLPGPFATAEDSAKVLW